MEYIAPKRNQTLDLIKLLSSYMVVFIHVLFYGEFGIVVDVLARFAVPLFFASAGFFAYQNSLKKIKKKAFNIFTLFLSAAFVHIVFDVFQLYMKGRLTEINIYFNNFFDIKAVVNLIVFNVPISSVHLWFLPALIYVYIMHYCISKFAIKQQIVFVIAFACLMINLFLGEFLSIFNIEMPVHFLRNFLLTGFPFFYIGVLIRKCSIRFEKINDTILIVFVVVGIIESLLSRYFFAKNELYVGSILILLAVMVFAIKYADKKYNRWLVLLTTCSTEIYIFHLIINKMVYYLCLLLNVSGESVAFQMIHPLVICIITTVFALGIKFMKNKFLLLKNRLAVRKYS